MHAIVRIKKTDYRRIINHLFETKVERAVFLYANINRFDGANFAVEGYHIVPPDGYVRQSPYYVELTDDEWAYLIKNAWDRRAALVEIHSHPHARTPVSFTPSDLAGFVGVVPHVRWRLRGKPYLAFVVAPQSFDALAWIENSHRPEPVEGILIGDQIHRPTGLTMARLRG